MEVKYCRHCDTFLPNKFKICPECKGYAPWIESYCPSCHSEDYVFHPYGFEIRKSIAGSIVAGPLGVLSGFIGSTDIECICLKCKQGWVISPTRGGIPTKKFNKIPEECF